MSWAALPVEPACMGKAVGEAGRPPMFVGLAEQIKLRGSGASPRRAMDAGRRGTGVFLWIDRG